MNKSALQIIKDSGLVKELHIYETTSSTNDRAKELIRENSGVSIDAPQLFISEVQTEGRGRMGRHWESPSGDGIWMSYLCKPNLEPDQIPGITLLAGLAITKSVMSYAINHSIYNLHTGIKWPNDLIINGKKYAGILTELVGDTGYIICGIGINVNTHGFPTELRDKATSLYKETGTVWTREELIYSSIVNLDDYIKKYEKAGDLDFIIDDYNHLLVSMNKEVVLSTQNDSSDTNNDRYIARGINKKGALIVEDSHGRLIDISSGEVSVRGVNGYI